MEKDEEKTLMAISVMLYRAARFLEIYGEKIKDGDFPPHAVSPNVYAKHCENAAGYIFDFVKSKRGTHA